MNETTVSFCLENDTKDTKRFKRMKKKIVFPISDTQNRVIFVGFDGGGSNSRVIIQTSDGTIVRRDFPQSIKYIDIGVEASAQALKQMITETCSVDLWEKAYITISLSGASDELKNNEFKLQLSKIFFPNEVDCHIESDSSFTLKAAYRNGESGYVIISGTGSVAIARDVDGKISKVGGWGRLLGDEGSGYWIGLQALKHYAGASDGAVVKGKLFHLLKAQLDEISNGDFSVLRSKLYAHSLYPATFASLVFESAEDPSALSIIREGANHLARNILLLASRSENAIGNIVTLHGSVACNRLTVNYITEALPKEFMIRIISNDQVLFYARDCSRERDGLTT